MSVLISDGQNMCLVRMQLSNMGASNSCHHAASFPGTRMTSGPSILV